MSSLKKKFPVKQLQVELIEPFIFSNHIYELYNGIYCNLCIRAYKFIMLDCDHEKISNILIESKKLINKKLSLFYGIQIETFKPKKEHYFYLITEMLENDISLESLKFEKLFSILDQITDLFIYFNSMSIEITLFPEDLIITKNYEAKFNNLIPNYFIKKFYGKECLLKLRNINDNKTNIYYSIMFYILNRPEYYIFNETNELLSLLKFNQNDLISSSNFLKTLIKKIPK